MKHEIAPYRLKFIVLGFDLKSLVNILNVLSSIRVVYRKTACPSHNARIVFFATAIYVFFERFAERSDDFLKIINRQHTPTGRRLHENAEVVHFVPLATGNDVASQIHQ